MRSSFIFLILVWSAGFAQNSKAPTAISRDPLILGETISFYSKTLKENRALNVYLPYGYLGNSDKKYPVIYLLDGDNAEDFIHISGLVQFTSFPKIAITPPSIVVGIANVNRNRDFTYPSKAMRDKLEYPIQGESSNFIDFIEDELQPFVKDNYRVSDISTLIGRSLGGLLATEILFKKPELFDNYIIVSPSLWWDNESLLKFKPKKFEENKAVYISVGKEGTLMEGLAYQLRNKIASLKRENINLYFKLFPDKDHFSILHPAVSDAFENIFTITNESR